MMSSLIIIAGLVLDGIFGEPKKYHPLAGFGRMAEWIEGFFRSLKLSSWPPVCQIMAGALALLLVVLPFVLCVCVLLPIHPVIYFIVTILVLYFCLGCRSLKQHCWAVYEALEDHDLERARAKVALIVSRDTYNMDEMQVRKAVIESSLENGSDAIFASIFWCFVGGAPLVLFHRLVNTLDAMWGYKTPAYLYFGRAAAKCDDALNYIPARIVAFSYACVGDFRKGWRAWREQAKLYSSPNAGLVMATGAGALNITLGGKVSYRGKPTPRGVLGFGPAPENSDVKKALELIDHTALFWCLAMVTWELCILWLTHD